MRGKCEEITKAKKKKLSYPRGCRHGTGGRKKTNDNKDYVQCLLTSTFLCFIRAFISRSAMKGNVRKSEMKRRR